MRQAMSVATSMPASACRIFARHVRCPRNMARGSAATPALHLHGSAMDIDQLWLPCGHCSNLAQSDPPSTQRLAAGAVEDRGVINSAEMDGEPNGRLGFRRPCHPMGTTGRDEEVVAGTKIALAFALDP